MLAGFLAAIDVTETTRRTSIKSHGWPPTARLGERRRPVSGRIRSLVHQTFAYDEGLVLRVATEVPTQAVPVTPLHVIVVALDWSRR